MTTIEQISEAYNKEGLCIPARNSTPAKVRGHDVRICMYPVNEVCEYRHIARSGNYCLLGEVFKAKEPQLTHSPYIELPKSLEDLIGSDEATHIETEFLRLYCNKYYLDMATGKMPMKEYFKDMKAKVVRYKSLVSTHIGNN